MHSLRGEIHTRITDTEMQFLLAGSIAGSEEGMLENPCVSWLRAGSWRDIYKGTYSLNANLLNSNASDIRGTDGDDYFYGFQGDNIYSFGSGFDTIDYSRLNESITLVRGGTVNKQENGIDTFTDFYDKLIILSDKEKLNNMVGYNFRLGEIESAIGIEQLKKLNFKIRWITF